MSIRAYVAFCLFVVVVGCNGDEPKVDAPINPDTGIADASVDAPTYDNCAGANTLTFANGFATGTADTAGARDDAMASCGGAGGPDVVLKFTTPMVGTLLVNVRPTGGSARAVISLRTDCGNPATEFGGCAVAANPGGGMLQVVRDMAAGTYYLWIDSADGQAAQYDVSLQLTVDAGDSCAGPVPITFTGGEVNVAASTVGSTNDESASCGGSSGPDNVFRFDLTAASNLDVSATTRNPSMYPLVALQTTCVGSDIGCAAAPTAGAGATLRLGSIAAGTHYLWVDSATSTAGIYNFTARIAAPGAGDTCALATALTFTNGMATATGNTGTWFNDSSGTCASGTAPDGVYTFTTTGVQNLRVDVTTTSSTYQPVVYLRSTTCTGTQLACGIAPTAGGTGSLTYGSLPAGTYYLWVDGANNTSGPFTLSALLGTPTQGDTCTLAKTLTFTGGMAMDSGDTSTWFHDSVGGCTSGVSPDGVYTFTTTTVQNLRVAVSTTTSTYQPAVYLRSASCTGSQVGCTTATAPGGTATLDIASLPIGTYYLWIDGANNTSGLFSLMATLSDPVPGDQCGSATALTFTAGAATATGTTVGLFNDGVGTCASGTAPDAIYSFSTSSVQELNVTVSTTTGTYQPAVYLRSANCLSGTQLGCATALALGGTATLDVAALPIGTYYLYIDGVNGTAGAYTLNATLTNPLPGDHCSNPIPLVFSGGNATASGTTAGTLNDGNGSCATGTAADVVYSFTASAGQDLRVSVSTTTGTYQPSIYLRSASCTGTQVGCANATFAGGTATLNVGSLSATTYYLWIDGVANTSGAYTINASLGAPLSGERCTGPEALVFSNGAAGGMAMTTGDTSTMFDDGVGTCGGSTGPDKVYSFTTNTGLSLTASVSTSSGTYRPVVYVRSATCTGTQSACAVAVSAGSTASLPATALPAGTYYLWVDSFTATGGPFTLMANLGALPAVAVRPVQPSNVMVPGPMTVTYEVVNALGGVVTTDNTTSFTIAANGSAVFPSASTGTILSGATTNTVLVRVSSGIVTLSATDSVAETVTYTATDTQGTGLQFPSGSGTAMQTSAQQSITATPGTINTFTLNFTERPSGNGTLTLTGFGDFDTASSEYLDVFMESIATGTNYGPVFGGTNQCSTTVMQTVTIPQAALTTYLLDGMATIQTRTGSQVDFCTGNLTVRLSFPTTNSAMFTP